MSGALVSVIVPVYNVQDTLIRCVNSIVAQSFFSQMEIILIDDGSTDDSGLLCDAYAQKYDNIHVVHQENSGLGATYNRGIAMASGEYIGLVESDDFIAPMMYETMYNNAKQNDSDLVKCGFCIIFDYQKYCRNGTVDFYSWDEGILQDVTRDKHSFALTDHKILLTYHSSIWATLYRSDFVKEIKFSTEPDASYQDFFFMIKCLTKARRISMLNEHFYFWNRCNPDASSARNNEKLMRILDQVIMSKQYLTELGLFDSLYSEFYKQAIIPIYGFYEQIRDDLKPVFMGRLREFFADIKPHDFQRVLKYFSAEQTELFRNIVQK